jgi:hypothetical protein
MRLGLTIALHLTAAQFGLCSICKGYALAAASEGSR